MAQLRLDHEAGRRELVARGYLCCDHRSPGDPQWVARIGAAEVARPLPEGRAMALVSVRPLQRDKVVRELHADAQPAVALIGYRDAK